MQKQLHQIMSIVLSDGMPTKDDWANLRKQEMEEIHKCTGPLIENLKKVQTAHNHLSEALFAADDNIENTKTYIRIAMSLLKSSY